MKRILLLFASILLIGGTALAATQGELGPSSQGDFDVNLVITNSANIKISGLENYHIDYKVTDDIPAPETMDICVYMDQPGTYTVNIDAAVLTDTVTNYPYTYTYTDNANSAIFKTETISDAASTAPPVSGFTSSNVDEDCTTGGTSATFELELDGEPGTATTQTAMAAITLTVEPD